MLALLERHIAVPVPESTESRAPVPRKRRTAKART
jgi:hypothetical protein